MGATRVRTPTGAVCQWSYRVESTVLIRPLQLNYIGQCSYQVVIEPGPIIDESTSNYKLTKTRTFLQSAACVSRRGMELRKMPTRWMNATLDFWLSIYLGDFIICSRSFSNHHKNCQWKRDSHCIVEDFNLKIQK